MCKYTTSYSNIDLRKIVHIPALLMKNTGIFCSESAILMQSGMWACLPTYTGMFEQGVSCITCTDLVFSCHINRYFFDYVTVCCITLTRMTNQVWQSNASRFRTDSAGGMRETATVQTLQPQKKRASDALQRLCCALNYFTSGRTSLHRETPAAVSVCTGMELK